jgi:hypothetical protein
MVNGARGRIADGDGLHEDLLHSRIGRKSRQQGNHYYPASAWFTCYIGGSYEFLSQPGGA